MPEPVVHYVVTSKTRVSEEKMSSEDENIEGVFGYTFFASEAKPLTEEQTADGMDPLEEHALDLYHADHAIAELDNYDISVESVESLDSYPGLTDHSLSTDVIVARAQMRR